MNTSIARGLFASSFVSGVVAALIAITLYLGFDLGVDFTGGKRFYISAVFVGIALSYFQYFFRMQRVADGKWYVDLWRFNIFASISIIISLFLLLSFARYTHLYLSSHTDEALLIAGLVFTGCSVASLVFMSIALSRESSAYLNENSEARSLAFPGIALLLSSLFIALNIDLDELRTLTLFLIFCCGSSLIVVAFFGSKAVDQIECISNGYLGLDNWRGYVIGKGLLRVSLIMFGSTLWFTSDATLAVTCIITLSGTLFVMSNIYFGTSYEDLDLLDD